MVIVSLITKFRTLAVALASAVSIFSASPALANSSAASADIAAPLRAAQAAKQSALGSGDEEFRNLFASWQSLDKPRTAAFAASSSAFVPLNRTSTTVAIPSIVPVDGVHLTSAFGMRWHPVTGGRHAHKGIDLAGPTGTPVHASADGVIGKAEWFSSYGLYVAIEHGGDIETRYGHMSRLNVAAGEHVHKGDVIGYIGTTGRSTGPHLHYEVRIAGEAVNPMPYMQGGVFQHLAVADTASAASGEAEGE